MEPRNTQQTKIAIKNATNAMDDVVKEILYGLSRLMPSGRRKLLRAYNLYDTIKNQLQTGDIKPITEDDLNANVMRIIRAHPDWRPRGGPVYYDIAGDDDDDDDDDRGGPPPPPDAGEPSPETPRPPSSREPSPPPPPEPRRRTRMSRKQPPPPPPPPEVLPEPPAAEPEILPEPKSKSRSRSRSAVPPEAEAVAAPEPEPRGRSRRQKALPQIQPPAPMQEEPEATPQPQPEPKKKAAKTTPQPWPAPPPVKPLPDDIMRGAVEHAARRAMKLPLSESETAQAAQISQMAKNLRDTVMRQAKTSKREGEEPPHLDAQDFKRFARSAVESAQAMRTEEPTKYFPHEEASSSSSGPAPAGLSAAEAKRVQAMARGAAIAAAEKATQEAVDRGETDQKRVNMIGLIAAAHAAKQTAHDLAGTRNLNPAETYKVCADDWEMYKEIAIASGLKAVVRGKKRDPSPVTVEKEEVHEAPAAKAKKAKKQPEDKPAAPAKARSKSRAKSAPKETTTEVEASTTPRARTRSAKQQARSRSAKSETPTKRR